MLPSDPTALPTHDTDTFTGLETQVELATTVLLPRREAPESAQPRRSRLARILLAPLAALGLVQGTAGAQSDWDLYAMRLINRARQDPAGEAAVIGSSSTSTASPAQPLAYWLVLGDAAWNHNAWMHDNFGNVPSGNTFDSFTHYETLDGSPGGTPATGSPSFTGVSVGDRATYAGYSWSLIGENLRANASSATIAVDAGRVEADHKALWESPGHQSNLLNAGFTAFGHRTEARPFTPPVGGLSPFIDNVHFATHVFGRPLPLDTRNYVLGLVYDDVDADGAWAPTELASPLHEGAAGIAYQVFDAGTTNQVASGTSHATGAFSVNLPDGTYDLAFAFPSGTVLKKGLTVAGSNVDAGDITSQPLYAQGNAISLAAGGTQEFTLQAGSTFAGSVYLLVGNVSGTGATPLGGGVVLPLVIDAYTWATLGSHVGVLDADGMSSETVALPAGLDPTLSGVFLHHAFVVINGAFAPQFASNSIPLELVD